MTASGTNLNGGLTAVSAIKRLYTVYTVKGNLLEFALFLHKYDLKRDQICIQVLKPDEETSAKQTRQKPHTCLFIY